MGLFFCDERNMEELYHIFLAQEQRICTDTRAIEKGCLFFALKGATFDGNVYAEKALENGAAYAIVDKKEVCKSDSYILVDDVLETLQALARFHRSRIQIPVIGITGSNGKTTTKELLHTALSQQYKTFATKGNLNNHIGVPISLLSIDKTHEMAIIEMGANHQGEIDFLCNIAQPDYGLITNIGMAHLEGFGGIEGVLKGKTELYRYIVANGGKVFVHSACNKLMQASEKMNRFTYGENDADYCFGKLLHTYPKIAFDWRCAGMNGHVEASLYGKYNYSNMLAAIAVACFFEVPAHKINKALSDYKSDNNRSQVLEKNGNYIILDAYNANPSSMQEAIEQFSEIPAQKKVVVLGDMFELGESSAAEHKKILELATSKKFSACIFAGKHFMRFQDAGNCFAETNVHAGEFLKNMHLQNAHILIKGSRGMQLEKVLEYL